MIKPKTLKERVVYFFRKHAGSHRPMEVVKGLRHPKNKKTEVYRVINRLEKDNFLIAQPIKKGGKQMTYFRNIFLDITGKKFTTFEEKPEIYHFSVACKHASEFEDYINDLQENLCQTRGFSGKFARHLNTILTAYIEYVYRLLSGIPFSKKTFTTFLLTHPEKTSVSEKVLTFFRKLNENEFEELCSVFEETLYPALAELKKSSASEKNAVSSSEKSKKEISAEGKDILRIARQNLKKSLSTEIPVPSEDVPLAVKRAAENLRKAKTQIKATPNYLKIPIEFNSREKKKCDRLEPDCECHIRYRAYEPLERDYLFYTEMVRTLVERGVKKWKIPTKKQFVEGRNKKETKKQIDKRKAAHYGRMRADGHQARYSDYAHAFIDERKSNELLQKSEFDNYTQQRNWGCKQLEAIYDSWKMKRLDEMCFNREDVEWGMSELLPENFNPDFDINDPEEASLFRDQLGFYQEVLDECERIHNFNRAYNFAGLVKTAISEKLLPASFVENFDFHNDPRLDGF